MWARRSFQNVLLSFSRIDQHPRQESVVPILFIIRSNCPCIAFVQVLSSHLVNRTVLFKASAELVFSTREDEVANE